MRLEQTVRTALVRWLLIVYFPPRIFRASLIHRATVFTRIDPIIVGIARNLALRLNQIVPIEFPDLISCNPLHFSLLLFECDYIGHNAPFFEEMQLPLKFQFQNMSLDDRSFAMIVFKGIVSR